MHSYWSLHRYPILMVLGSILFYAVFAYDLEREDFPKLLCLFTALFFLSVKLIQFEKWNFKFLAISGILFRIVFLIAEPNLSQDFYRFIWDGELINQGVNPYLYSPNQILENIAVQIPNANILHDGMGALSAKNFSNYPPLNQLIFTISSFLGGGNIMANLVIMRLFIVAADVGILYFGRKLLLHLGRSPHFIFWYFINPLVIIELTGNLHFEGVMLFFFVWALYFIAIKKWQMGAVIYAFSILLKLVPVLFLPLFLNHYNWKKSLPFFAIIGITCLLGVLPFYSPDFLTNYVQTVGLWFSNFEFNASVYNLIKGIGVLYFDAKPWELIKSYGSWVPKIMIFIALMLTFLRQNTKISVLFGSMLALLSCYYFLSSTVHPWYIVFLLLLSVFTGYRFAIAWSAAVVLSYFAYSNPNFDENLWLLLFEYAIIIAFLGYEMVKNHNNSLRFRKKIKHK